ncbi:hypothetical protein KR222_008417 [Zaprionus bogoriensis]|nr:hypothetical protein KR222_008417 [Zaprionus bogoriensis]
MLRSLFLMRLNTAGVVIGWLGVVGSFVMIIAQAVILGFADVIAQAFVKESDDKIKYEEVHTAIIVAVSVYLAICALNFMASGMLVLGTMKERHLMLLPWLINSGIALAITIVYDLVGLVAALRSGSAEAFVLPIIVGAIGLALQVYIYCGIYSLYKQIQYTREQQRPLIEQQPVQHSGTSYPNYTKM